MGLDSIIDFLIDGFITIVSWFYNLRLPITSEVSIPLGAFILSFFVLALIINIFTFAYSGSRLKAKFKDD